MMGIPLACYSLSDVAPSDKIRVAHIGTGNMGGSHIRWFSAFPDVETVALCDVDKNHLERAQKSYSPATRQPSPTVFRFQAYH